MIVTNSLQPWNICQVDLRILRNPGRNLSSACFFDDFHALVAKEPIWRLYTWNLDGLPWPQCRRLIKQVYMACYVPLIDVIWQFWMQHTNEYTYTYTLPCVFQTHSIDLDGVKSRSWVARGQRREVWDLKPINKTVQLLQRIYCIKMPATAATRWSRSSVHRCNLTVSIDTISQSSASINLP